MKAIVVHETGGPENLKYQEVQTPIPGPGEVLIRIHASGVNFIDIYFRKGLYPAPERPMKMGMEAAGVVEAIGPDVTTCQPGDRVAYCMERGSYAEYAVVPAWKLLSLPDEVDFITGAQLVLQGLTAHYLTRSTYVLNSDSTCLVHAAGGGTGTLIVQIAKLMGARVIGTVSNQKKAQRAKEAGCDHIINYKRENFVEITKQLTEGKGVDVVYDGVGKSTFLDGLDTLRPRGMMALFGQASGPVAKFDPQLLNQKGSLFLTRPSLGHYASSREELIGRAEELFRWVASGKLKTFGDRSYSLESAAEAQSDLEGRKSLGKLTLTVL